MGSKVILSFDYELFFGNRCGMVDECLISTTQKILETLKAVGGCAVFFVDYLMLKRMREECDETRRDALKIEEQLKEIVRAGSRIELHLHTHWLDAKYNGNGAWDFSDYRHYCIHSIPKAEATRMLMEGTCYLNTIARQVEQDYNVCAFRAGGWAIMPFNHLEEGFEIAGLKYDSSVCQHMVLGGVNYKMDFSHSPTQAVYNFSTDVLSPTVDGKVTEVQISSFRYNLLTYIADGVYRKLNKRKYRHYVIGSYMKSGMGGDVPKTPFFKRFTRRAVFGIDTTSWIVFLLHMVLARRAITVVMGHPKDFNDLMAENIRFLGLSARYVTYNDVLEVK